MAKKYIVGDWVKFLFEESKVIEVYEDGSYYMDSPNITGCPKEEELSPITLTPEILEKNGWKKSKINDCEYFYYKDGLFLTYTSKDDKFWFDDFDYSSSICVYIPYVHSLQHLLFGLGLNSEMEV